MDVTVKNHRLVVDGKPVKFVKTPNGGAALKNPIVIIQHDTAGRLNGDSSVSWLCNPKAKASAHLVVDREGNVTQLMDFNKQTWHAGKSVYKGKSGVNSQGIGIEYVNPGLLSSSGRAWFGETFDVKKYGIEKASTEYHGTGWWMPYTPEQINLAVLINMALMTEYKTLKDISTHWFISPKRKVDTNPLFPLDYVRSRVLGRGDNDPSLVVRSGATIRQYPSFYKSNILVNVKSDTKGMLKDSGTFEFAGDSPVTGSSPRLWMKVECGKVVGWVLATEVEMT